MGRFLGDAEIRGFQNRIHELEFALAETEALEISHGERIEKQAKRIKELEAQLEKNNPLLDEAADKIDALEETIAAQAAVIEKLRAALIHHQWLTRPVERTIDALAIPTDSKEVLKEWLDSVMGEPVRYLNHYNKHGETWDEVHFGEDNDCVYATPLFRKSEVK